METTEKVVEAYVRYVKHCATIPNIKCGKQFEIDLLAINPASGDRYHIESSVSISALSKLTNKPFDATLLKERVEMPRQRRTLGFFIERKFSEPEILATLGKYGFAQDNYKKVIVAWDAARGVIEEARRSGVEVWEFRSSCKK